MASKTTPVIANTPETDEGLSVLLEALHKALDKSFDSENARRLIARTEGSGEPLDRIAKIAPRFGMVPVPIHLSPYQIPRLVGPSQPLVVSAPTSSEVLAILETDGNRVRVVSPSLPSGAWFGPAEVADRLGLSGPDVETPCLTIEPAVPMNALSFPGAQPGDVRTALRRLLGLLATERADLQAIVIYAVGAGVFTLTLPVAVQTLVNTVAFGALTQPLVVMTILVIGGLVLYGGLTSLEVYIVEILQRRILLRVVGDLSYRVPRSRTSALDRIYGPEQLNRFFDVFTIHKATAQLLLDGLDLALRGSIGLLLLAFYHPILLAFDVILIICLTLVLFGLGQGGLKSAIVESKKKYRLAGWLEELGRRPALFKTPAAMRLAHDRADALTRDFLVARMNHFRVVLRQTIGALGIYAISSGALLGIGGWLVIDGQLTLGQLVAAELVLTAVVTAFAKMGKHLESFYDLVAAVDKVGALFDLPTEDDGGDGELGPTDPRGSSFEVESLSLGMGGRPVLKDVNLKLAPGDRAALVGKDGSGKSVFSEVAFGLRHPSSGWIRLDGIHLDDLPLATVRSKVAVARTDDIMQGSILENLRLGDPAVCTATARQALEQVELSEVVARLADNVDTMVFPGGRPLTEAESARLVIARAVASKPSLLVIDGLLDLQDEQTRARVLERLSDPAAPWTLLVLTRLASLARSFPRAFEIEAGRTSDLEPPPRSGGEPQLQA